MNWGHCFRKTMSPIFPQRGIICVGNYVDKGEIMNYTYILRCGDNSLYTGWTNNLEKRLEMHKAGKGAKYTKARLPVELVYYETFDTKEDAMRREYAIKQMKKKEKEMLIRDVVF